ncbi:MAG: hypothetical protein ABIR96_07440 [Bdellovibrionota bacterium]
MSFSCSKFFGGFVVALVLVSCSEKLEVAAPHRQNFKPLPTTNLDPAEIEGDGLILEEDIYAPAKFMTACTWLDSLAAKAHSDEQGFRILEDFGVRKEGSGWKGPWDDDARFPFFQDKKNNDPANDKIDLANLYGRIQLNDNPLYEYGLVKKNGSIPDRSQFLELVDKEIFKSPIKILPLIAARAAMTIGVINPYKKRNEIVQKQIADALPGAFDKDFSLYALKDTFPDILVKNGAPFAEVLNPLPSDSVHESEKKAEEIKKVLSVLAKRLPMFREHNWSSFRDDMRWGLSAGIRGMQSTNPVEQACGAAIFHRGFAQMLSVKGYDRPPLEFARGPKGSRWSLVDIKDFLESEKGTRLKACPGVGSFTRDGRATQVRDAELADTSGAGKLSLSSVPLPLKSCQPGDARILELKKQQATVFGPRSGSVKSANLEQKLEFLSGVSYFLMAFAPGSKWWFDDKGLVSYPLADFGEDKELKDILSSGGLMPYESFALSLGFLNLAGNNLINKHLVYVDRKGVEVGPKDEVFGVRISDRPRVRFEKGPVVTDIHSVLLLTDVIFKLHETLDKMAVWLSQTERSIREEIRKNPDSAESKRMQKDFDNFVHGLFGGRDTLVLLTESGPDSVRKQVDDFRLALSLVLARFVKSETTLNTAGKPVYTCFEKLQLDPVTGVEERIGTCGEERSAGLQSELELFRQSMRLVGRAFQSPLYMEYGQEN